MSVINNVLKDLEARESAFTPIEIPAIAGSSARRRGFKPALLAAMLVIPAAGAFYLLHSQPATGLDGTANVAANQPPVVAGRSENTLPKVASAAPAGLVGIEIEPAADGGISALQSSNPAAAHLDELSPAEVSAVEMAAVTDGALAASATAVHSMPPPVNQIIGLQLRESEQEMQMEFELRDRVVAYLRERGENHFGYRLRAIESQIVAPSINDNRWIRQLSIEAAGGGVDIDFRTAPNILVETRQSLVDGQAVWVISLRQAALPAAEAAPVADARAEPVPPAAADTPAASAPVIATAETGSAQAREPQAVKLEIRATDPAAKDSGRLEYAVELVNSRRPREAEKLLRELLGGAEDNQARQHLIALYQRDKRLDRVMQVALESMQLYPRDGVFRTEYARALFHRKAYRDVIALFADAAEADAAQLSLVAASHQRLDQHVDAVRHYRLALAQDAGNARNWVGLGISQEHTAALQDALESYVQAGRLGGLNEHLLAFVIERSNTLRRVLN